MTPDEIRAWVRTMVARGADVIKIFASKSIREGGGQTLSDAQIRAACDEARRPASERGSTRIRYRRRAPRRSRAARPLRTAAS